MTIGHCPHGEFVLEDGCPQCVADFKALGQGQAASPMIVKVRYYSETTNELSWREYTYFTAEPLAMGDVIRVPVRDTTAKAKVTGVNVPEAEIAAFRDKVKTIPAGSTCPDPSVLTNQESIEIGTTEGQMAYLFNQTKDAAQVARLFNQPPVTEPTSLAEAVKAAAIAEGVEVKEVNLFNQPATLVGNIEDTGTAIQPPLVSTEEPEKPVTLMKADGEIVKLDTVQEAVEQWSEGSHITVDANTAEVTEAKDEITYIPPALAIIETHVGKSVPGLFQLYQEAAGLLRIAKDRVIKTNEDLIPATNDLAIIATCKKAMAARKAEFYGPYKAEFDRFNQALNDLMFPVLEADRLTRGQVTAYDNQVRVQAAEAKRIEDEKLRLAKEEAAFNEGEITVPLGTVEAPPVVPANTWTDLGTLGGRTNWKARVVDMKLLPDEYKLPDMSTLNAKAKSEQNRIDGIPGVEFYDDRVVTMRTKGGQ